MGPISELRRLLDEVSRFRADPRFGTALPVAFRFSVFTACLQLDLPLFSHRLRSRAGRFRLRSVLLYTGISGREVDDRVAKQALPTTRAHY